MSEETRMSTPDLRQRLENALQSRLRGLLLLVVLVQTIYPITEGDGLWSLLVYNGLSLLLVFSGILVARRSPVNFKILVVMGALWGVAAVFYALEPDQLFRQGIAYLAFAAFELMVIRVLLQFMFASRRVSGNVIYAAVAVYFLLGAVFVPVYGGLETATYYMTGDHAFSDGLFEATGIDSPLPWQHFVYYSYVTLTTLGYGDILPVTMWARSLASLQAIVGVMYVTIVMARLVSLYVSQESEGVNDTS